MSIPRQRQSSTIGGLFLLQERIYNWTSKGKRASLIVAEGVRWIGRSEQPNSVYSHSSDKVACSVKTELMEPMGRRPSSRLLVIDQNNRVLLFRFQFERGPLAGQEYWATPGVALEAGESFVDAARRELFEERGIVRRDAVGHSRGTEIYKSGGLSGNTGRHSR